MSPFQPTSAPGAATATPGRYGLAAWTFDTGEATSSPVPAAGDVNVCKVEFPSLVPLVNLFYGLDGVATAPTAGQCFLGIYSITTPTLATLIWTSPDQSGNYGSTGIKTVAISPAASPSTPAFYVAQLFNGTTGPSIRGNNNTSGTFFNMGVPALSGFKIGRAAAGQTSLPATFDPSAMTATTGQAYYFTFRAT